MKNKNSFIKSATFSLNYEDMK